MVTGERSESVSSFDEVMEDSRRDVVRWVAAADRDASRDIYDALEDE